MEPWFPAASYSWDEGDSDDKPDRYFMCKHRLSPIDLLWSAADEVLERRRWTRRLKWRLPERISMRLELAEVGEIVDEVEIPGQVGIKVWPSDEDDDADD